PGVLVHHRGARGARRVRARPSHRRVQGGARPRRLEAGHILKRIHPTVLLMASAHFMVDGYGNIYAPLLPLLIPKLHLTLAAAGTLTMCYQMAASVAQVGFGHLADRWRPRLLVMTGPVIAVTVLSFIGVAPSPATLAAILVVGGLGAAAFHPPA